MANDTNQGMRVRITSGHGRWGKDWEAALIGPHGYTLHSLQAKSEERARERATWHYGADLVEAGQSYAAGQGR